MADSALRQFLEVSRVLLSHYLRHPGQAIFMAVGLVAGVALWSAVQLLNDHARASYAEADEFLGAEAKFWVRSRDASGVTTADYIRLRRLGFTSLYPVLESRLRTSERTVLSLVATDLLALPNRGANAAHPFASSNWLALIQPPYQVWFPESVASQLGIKPGDQLPLQNGLSLPPAVIQTQEQQGQRLFMDVGAAMAVLGESRFSYLGVGALDAHEKERLVSELPASLLLVPNEQSIDLTQLTESLHTNLSALGLLSFAVGLFIVFNAVRYSLVVRERTLTTLREMGASVRMLGASILAESLAWSVLGTAIGLATGLVIAQQLMPAVSLSLQSLYGAIIGADIGLSVRQALIALLMTLGGVVLALALPLWQAANRPIRDNSGAEIKADHLIRRSLQLALILFGLALLGYLEITSLIHGFVVIGLAMLAGAAFLPPLIHLLVRMLGRGLPEKNWQLRWAVSDALSQLPHLRIALMALLLTLTANIGVTVLVDSFRTALGNWLETRLSADLYVQSNELNISRLLENSGEAWLKDYHQRIGTSFRWQGRPTRVTGVDIHAPDIRNLTLSNALPEVLERLQDSAEPELILANEQVQFLAGKKIGTEIELPTSSGSVRFVIAGFFHDYGNSGFQFYLPNDILSEFWPEASPQGLALWLEPGHETSAEAALIRAGALPGEWIWQGDIKAVSFQIFDRTFAITAALNTLTLLVAGVALLAALLAVHQSRLPEYSHWRSVGLNYSEGFRIVALPLAMMAIITLGLALPLGYLLSWLLIHKLNVIAFGWTMPLLWTWAPALQLGLLTIGIVLITLFIAALQVRRRLPAAVKLLGNR